MKPAAPRPPLRKAVRLGCPLVPYPTAAQWSRARRGWSFPPLHGPVPSRKESGRDSPRRFRLWRWLGAKRRARTAGEWPPLPGEEFGGGSGAWGRCPGSCRRLCPEPAGRGVHWSPESRSRGWGEAHRLVKRHFGKRQLYLGSEFLSTGFYNALGRQR